MNTNSLKRFATVARNLLMQGVRNRLKAVGFNDDGSVRVEPVATGNSAIFDGQVINDSRFVARWNALRDRIASHGVKEVVEEAAYTWFNRLMAIRILEYNNLAPALLDYENPEIRIPRIVTDARAGKTPMLSDEDRASLEAVISDGRLSFEQFSLLIRAYCENNPIIRKCFGGITDYTALLLPADILAEDGFIDLLNKAGEFIEPDDYRKPELIGWLYQFYIAEKKDEVFAKKGGYDSDEIPAATQIFTPNWIVKYMVENTLGRIYLDNHPDDHFFSEKWKYLVNPADPTPQEAVLHYDTLEEFTCADLSCGSGHILNEMFDLLMQLYEDDFYSPREAIEAIFTKNMVGIDLDIRARQLSQFALLLKACQRDSAFADGHCLPRIYSFPEVDRYTWLDLNGHFNCAYQLELPNNESISQIKDVFELMENADALGSIMKFDICEEGREYLRHAVIAYDSEPKHTDIFASLVDGFRVILALSDKYAALCMNPPYMPTNKEATLKAYAAKQYPDSKADLFAIFMDVAIDRLREHGKYGMINMQSWMFLSSFEALRKKIIDEQHIDSLLHLGPRTFDELSGEVVQNAAFVITKEKPQSEGIYYRLIDGKSCSEKQENFFDLNNRFIIAEQSTFDKIPGNAIGYWLSNAIINLFSNSKINDLSDICVGIQTGDNDKYIHYWYEVDNSSLYFGCKTSEESILSDAKWYPYNKGGNGYKWYGGNYLVVNWYHDGEDIRKEDGSVLRNQNFYFHPCLTFPRIGSGKLMVRYSPTGALFDINGPTIYSKISRTFLLGYLNSKVLNNFLSILCPTLTFQVGDVGRAPCISQYDQYVDKIVDDNIKISKSDWDSHETSWDFEKSPLLAAICDCNANVADLDMLVEDERDEVVEMVGNVFDSSKLEDCVNAYISKWTRLFHRLHTNEEELNRKFIDIYGLQDELTPGVALEDVTILQQGEIKIKGKEEGYVLNIDGSNLQIPVSLPTRIEWQRDVVIKQFISYAMGCMMGRYRLDRPGLAIAHPNPSADEYAPYVVPQTGEQWWIDDDGIVPMMGDDSPFHDNAANRFTEFVRVTLGNEYLTENMNFVRDALGKDVVDYFRSDFYNDHKKMYQNRPIYWMFSSNQKGKRAAFQCLVYMHRMNRFTPEHIRTNYLLPYIDHLAAREAELSARSSLSAKENKLLKQLRGDLEECRDYQLRLHEFADRQIEIDLDDGVVKNYATFAPVLAKLK